MPMHLWGAPGGIQSSKDDRKAEYANDDWTTTPATADTLDRRRGIRQRTHNTSKLGATAMATDEESQTASTGTACPRKRPLNSSFHHRWFLVVLRHCANSHNWHTAWIWMKKNRRLVYCILASIPFILRPSRVWKWRYTYFGKHKNHGGELGQRIEKWGNLARYDEVQARQQDLLHSLGILMPPGIPLDRASFRVLELDTQAAIRELLVRREQRAKTLSQLERQANSLWRTCTSQRDGDFTEFPNLAESQSRNPNNHNTSCSIPRAIFVPDKKNGWQPPRPGKSKRYQQIIFSDLEMRQFILDTRPSLVRLFDELEDDDIDRIHLWAVCTIYHVGGVYVGPNKRSDGTMILESLVWAKHGPILGKHGGFPFAVTVLDQTQNIHFLAATPRHPALLCLLRQWESGIDGEQMSTSATDGSSVTKGNRNLVKDSFLYLKFGHVGWTRTSLPLQRPIELRNPEDTIKTNLDSHECNVVTESLTAAPDQFDMIASTPTKLEAQVFVLQLGAAEAVAVSSPRKINVSIDEELSVHSSRTEKVTLESQLKQQGLEPGWFCMRCVKIPQYGRMERCARFCPAGYTDLVCHGPDIPEKKLVNIHVQVRGPSPTFQSETAIPKVIHQTWFEDVTLDRYPQLARLQNSWRNTGWKYRLYTDETARAYIVDHFPSRFVDAFDALIPGAFKADLFRYLVLMREGGVYADVDILLETNLDQFITSSLSFFAPRDVVAEFAGEPFCLWNGLIGAAPGHPFIIRAVERLVNLILERADVFDLERDLCRGGKGSLEMWKVRLQTLLLLSGPCGLGVSVNEVLGKSSMQKIDTGWIGLDELEYGGKKDHGDALIMVVDKHDMDGFRISDPEGSTIVASTNFIGLEKHAREISNPTEAERKRQEKRKPRKLTHYSTSNKGIFVWGSSGVYKDSIVTNQRIKLDTRYVT